jgi:energy-converting hydrogenase B subunit D
MSGLIAVLFLLVAATGTVVALSRVPRHQVIAMAANGLALSLLFMALQAPDGTAAIPLLFLVVLASIRTDLITERVERPAPGETPPVQKS